MLEVCSFWKFAESELLDSLAVDVCLANRNGSLGYPSCLLQFATWKLEVGSLQCEGM